MRELADMSCVPCQGNTPPLSEIEVRELITLIPEWTVIKVEKVPQLERTYSLPDFARALHFGNKIGEMAEIEDHHPELLIQYGQVVVRWWTHSVGGLHRNDFILAARTDKLFGQEKVKRGDF